MAAAPRVPQMVDGSPFQVGRNIAVTPGAVVLRTELLELIQYRPQTERVREVPLLIVPPTINKYYALDLAPGRSLVEYLVRDGQQVFVISWRNPDARHAGWGLDTYVQAVLDALDAVAPDLRDRPGRAVRGLLRRHHRRLAAAHLAATGAQDRLAAFALGVTVLDYTAPASPARWSTAGSPRRRRRVAAARLPGRAVAGRGVRLAAPRRPDLELLGQQLPARPQAAGVRHAVLERRHHPDAGPHCTPTSSTWRWTTRWSTPGALTVLGMPVDLSRVERRHLPRRRHRRPPHPVAELLPQHPVARRAEPVRPVHQRPHRRAGQPAGQPEGHLPGQQGEPGRPAGVAAHARTPSRAAGGRTPWPGSASAAAPSVAAPAELGGARPAHR